MTNTHAKTETQSAALTRSQAWKANPLAVSDDEHKHYCEDGYLVYQSDTSAFDLIPCPICNYTHLQSKLKESLERSGVGSRYFTTTFDDLNMLDPFPKIKKACDNITHIITEGHSVCLYGEPGTGKTQAAVLCIKAAIATGHTARLDNMAELSVYVRDSYKQDMPLEAITETQAINQLSDVDLLVIDDLGAAESKKGTLENRLLHLSSNRRQNNKKATIITTNLTKVELGDAVGLRVLNRFQPLDFIPFKHGQNFRTSTQSNLWDGEK